MQKSLLCFLSTFIFTGVSFADLTYGGDGCPAGTAQVSVDANGAWHLELDAFDVQMNTSNLERKSCNIAIPIQVPSGYSASFGEVTITGTHDLKQSITALFDAETFFAGTSGPRYSKAINGESSGAVNFTFLPNVAWSQCGQSPILRLNSSVVLKANKTGLGLSSMKIDEIIIGRPNLKKCS